MKNEKYPELQSITDPLDGVTLIEAAAGTGKTYNIQNLVARLIVEKNYPIESIVVVTFTDAAAKELSDRLRLVLESLAMELHGQYFSDKDQQQRAVELIESFRNSGIEKPLQLERINTALRDFDNNWVSTIHAFCARILNENAFESSVVFRTRLEKNIAGYIEKLLTDYRRINRYRQYSLPEPDEKTIEQFCRDIAFTMNRRDLRREMGGDYFENSTDFFQALDEIISEIKALPLSSSLYALENFEGKLNQIDGMKFDEFIQTYVRKLKILLEDPEQEHNYQYWAQVTKRLAADFLRSKASKRPEEQLKKTLNYIEKYSFFELAEKYKNISETGTLCWKLEAGNFVRHELARWKEHENFQGFDDLLLRVDDALKNGMLRQVLQQRFHAGIIDEFQDTDPVQYSIFKQIFIEDRQDTVFFMVGDPRQAIYSFRGGDMATYMQAREECEANERGVIRKLSRNFRSSWPMINAFNVLFDHPDFFGTDKITAGETLKGPKDENAVYRLVNSENQGDSDKQYELLKYPLQINDISECESEIDVYTRCADEIVHLLNSDTLRIMRKGVLEPITPGDIAVLAFFNSELETIRRELIARNVPVVCERKQGIWGSVEAAELAVFMYGVLENSQESLLREALLTDLGGLTLNDLDNNLPENEENFARWRRMMRQLNECWHQYGTAAFIELACRMDFREQHRNFRARMAAQNNGERVIANYTQLTDLLGSAELFGSLSPRGVWNYLNENITRGQSDGEFAENMESDAPAVKLMTIHGSKGLQFPIVFLPALGTNYPLRISGMKVYHRNNQCCINPDERLQDVAMIAAEEELQEQLRLIYVACTRACSGCFISWNGSKFGNSAMDWILRMRSLPKNQGKISLQKFADKNWKIDLRPLTVVPAELGGEYCFPEKSGDKYVNTGSSGLIEPPEEIAHVQNQWRMLSYSSLGFETHAYSGPMANADDIEGIDRDRDDARENLPGADGSEVVDEARLTGGIWNIPGGAAVGNAWHKILEVMDFTSPVDAGEVARILRMYDLGDPAYVDGSCQMLEKLMNYPLHCNMKFCELPSDKKVNEFEFLLSSSHGMDLNRLLDAVNPYLQKEFSATYPLDHQLKTTGGFFNGFIDMIFEHEQRFYIVDWKSNKLDALASAFSGEKLRQAMFNAAYPIQYLCYTAALVRHLEHRLGVTFDETLYDKYIGGVYYIFLRGMSLPQPGGVFAARVPFQTVQALLDVIN